jgi:hypothetical protein
MAVGLPDQSAGKIEERASASIYKRAVAVIRRIPSLYACSGECSVDSEE